MPIGAYFKGAGERVMAKMRGKYGDRAEEVFYKTANAKPMFKPPTKMRKAMKSAMNRGGKRTENYR